MDETRPHDSSRSRFPELDERTLRAVARARFPGDQDAQDAWVKSAPKRLGVSKRELVAIIEVGRAKAIEEVLTSVEAFARSIPSGDERFSLALEMVVDLDEIRRSIERGEDTAYEMALLVERLVEAIMRLHGPHEPWRTLTEAAKRYCGKMDGDVNFRQAKTYISRACKRGELRHRGTWRTRRICPIDLDRWILAKRDAALHDSDE